jgi:hypothetical protein
MDMDRAAQGGLSKTLRVVLENAVNEFRYFNPMIKYIQSAQFVAFPCFFS